MNTFDSDNILAGLESYIDELPAKRRRKRTREEIYNPDLSPEAENYDKLSLWDSLFAGAGRAADNPAMALILSWEIQGRIALLYRSTLQRPGVKEHNAALPDLVKRLAEMAGGEASDEIQDRAVGIFYTLEWERQQAILYVTVGRHFATEADWLLFQSKKGGAK